MYIPRLIEPSLHHHLARGKSILLLGPRQTGKSTLLGKIVADLSLSFLLPRIRQHYEQDPSALFDEVAFMKKEKKKRCLVILDEIQKVPAILDVVQELIDKGIAQFILTGSSARKLRRGPHINLLPGRLVQMRLDPFVFREFEDLNLKDLLTDGSLPGICTEKKREDRETDLASYVETYLEEEIRSEAIVRNMGNFSRFLEYAGLESGKIVNCSALSQEIGVSYKTIASYYEILVDCLIAERIDPITKSTSRKKLTKSARYLLFDLGIRRLCAKEGDHFTPERWGDLLEHYVGLELVRYARLSSKRTSVRFWRDPDGPEVDWVLECDRRYIPIEVKWTDRPGPAEAKHIALFLHEYPEAEKGYIICRSPRPFAISKTITALPWQELNRVFEEEV